MNLFYQQFLTTENYVKIKKSYAVNFKIQDKRFLMDSFVLLVDEPKFIFLHV